MPQHHKWVQGGACFLTMYRETSPGCVPNGSRGVRLALMNENFGRGESKRQRTVITGKRGPGKPYLGQPQFTGQVTAASYSPQLGYLMNALCGDCVTVQEQERSLSEAAVVKITDCRVRAVGLPCPNHGFVQDSVITVYGTQNYDGQYRVAYGTTADVIAIHAPYVAETLQAGAKVYRGRAPLLEGAARDRGSGQVGLPTEMGVHDLNPGEKIILSGTDNYDGTYELLPGSENGLLVIEATYAAETFDGTLVAVPIFYRHFWKLPKKQPTICMEKYLDFDDDAGALRFQRFGLCKMSNLNYNLGGDQELVFTINFAVGLQENSDEPIDPTPLEPAAIPLDNIEAALWLAGTRRGDVETGSFTNNFNVTARAAIGDLGRFSRMSEGDPQCSASLQAFMEEGDYQALAEGRYTLPFAVSISGASGDECWFRYGEAELDVPGQPITGKEGLMQTVNVMGFVNKRTSILDFELINRVDNYAA
jgi:hypothetical protein